PCMTRIVVAGRLRDFQRKPVSCGLMGSGWWLTAAAFAGPTCRGTAMRLLAPDGGTLVRGIEAAFHVASRAALGVELAPRRKGTKFSAGRGGKRVRTAAPAGGGLA